MDVSVFIVSKTDRDGLEILRLLQIEVEVNHYGRKKHGTIKDSDEVMKSKYLESLITEFDVEVLKRTTLWKLCV
jgi:hypothetical protein